MADEIIDLDLPVESELGEPDFSALMNDDDMEISSADITGGAALGKKGLKASHAIEKLVPSLFAVIAKRKGAHWILEQEEVEEFGQAFDECMEAYFPEINGLPSWAMLAFSSGMIVIPRLMIDSMTEDEKKAVSEQLEDSAVGSGTVLRAENE